MDYDEVPIEEEPPKQEELYTEEYDTKADITTGRLRPH